MPKREDYISWDEYFMSLAKISAMRSKDPKTQVGACIVGKDNRILSLGYNGFPNGASDDDFPWEKEGSLAETKFAYVVHAELNAILNAHTDLTDSTLYVTLYPCNECAKAIVQSGIKKVVYEKIKHPERDDNIASTKIFKAAGVEITQYSPTNNTLTINV